MSRWLVTQPERSYNRLRLYIALPFLRAGRNLGMQPPLQPPPSKPFRHHFFSLQRTFETVYNITLTQAKSNHGQPAIVFT